MLIYIYIIYVSYSCTNEKNQVGWHMLREHRFKKCVFLIIPRRTLVIISYLSFNMYLCNLCSDMFTGVRYPRYGLQMMISCQKVMHKNIPVLRINFFWCGCGSALEKMDPDPNPGQNHFFRFTDFFNKKNCQIFFFRSFLC